MKKRREFPGELVDRIPGFHCHGIGPIPGWGTEIPQAAWHGQIKNKINKLVREDIQMANKHMKRCSMSLVLSEM